MPIIRSSRHPATAPGLLHDQRGGAAIEFGLVSLPFLSMIAALIQVSFMIWAQQNLDFALQKTVRSLLTGQFQAANSGTTNAATILAALQANMCTPGGVTMAVVFDCSAVKLDVTIGKSFGALALPVPVDPSTKTWATNFGTHYTCASPGAFVITTAAVKFPLFFKLMLATFADFDDGSILLESTAVFRTEPYGTSTC